MTQKKPVVAVFDFDGTLTTRDTLFPFLLHVVGLTRFVSRLVRSVPALIGYATRTLPNDVAKQRLLINYLSGMGNQELEMLGKSFANDVLPTMLRKRAMDRMQWHQKQGHSCVVISASLDVYLTPWAAQFGIDKVLCTSLETGNDGIVTGRLATKNCYGVEKCRRLEEWLGTRSDFCIYAYGDSRGDRELLAMADYSFYRSIPATD